jgi:hypothetical protein
MASALRRIFLQEDPRKVAKGTSYKAKGIVASPAEAMKEHGSSQPVRIPDVVPQFSSRSQQLRIFKEMEDGDVTVDVSLRAIKTPIMGATFFVQPFDSKPINKDIAEFVKFNIFEGTATPFPITMEHILRMFNDGWSVLEQVYETREWAARKSGANRKNYTMLKKLAPRPALTIKEIKYDDNGGPLSIVQSAIRAEGEVEEVEIKVDQLLIFTFGGLGGDLQGKSILRTAYNPWYFKKELYKVDAIGHERNHLGLPGIEIENEGFSKADVDAAWEMVTNVRTNERAGFVTPPGFKFVFASPEGQASDILPSIEHHDSHILLNVLAQFLMLGLTGGGGRATSGSHVDMFQKSVRYFADYICAVLNLYCVPKLVGYNFDTTEFPQVKVRNVGETKDLQMWASAHANLITAGALTMDDDSENWYRENLDMPFLIGSRPVVPVANPNGKGAVQPANRKSGTGNTKTDAGAESVG